MAVLPTLRQLRPIKSNLFQYYYSPKYSPPQELSLQLKELNPLAIRNKAIYEQRPKIGLWYKVKAATAISPKRLPRSKTRRKLLLAFQDALRSHHLDERGIVQQSLETARLQRGFVLTSLEMEPAPIDLRGMLHLVPNASLLMAEREDVREQVGVLVKYLLRYQWLSPDLNRYDTDR